MDASEFRKRGREMVDYIADYMTQIRSRRVTPEVEPGYIRKLLPSTAPKKGEEWESIMVDLERAVMPGITHWQHPHFHAYFPAGNSYPSILGDMLSDAISCIGFSWAASPACVELETLVLDWVGKMIELPRQFLHSSGQGGGVIQGSASECVLVALLSARHHTIRLLKQRQPYIEECQILSKLVGYCSKLAHSCVEKAGMIGFVKMRHLDVDENFALRGHVLEDAIEEDKKLGLIPFFVCATLGTTACCSFDNLSELGEVAKRQGVYLHVDAAYAGNALICPEFQYLKEGVENVDSFGFNTNKWLQVNFDCSLMWVKNVDILTTALTVDPLYLQHKHGDKAIDLRHWGIPLSRRFRALKLWFVIRTYGVEGLQKRIREHCRLAKMFASKVLMDDRFEVFGEVTMGLVCFRLLGPNSLTQKLLKTINDGGKLHMVPAMLNEHYIIRFALCTEYACDDDVNYAWKIITSAATDLLQGRQRCDSNKEEHSCYDLNSVSDEDTFAAFEEEIIFDNQREHLQRAQVMRSLFFKMVSDPKCYNPRVLKSLSRQVTTQRKNITSAVRQENVGQAEGGTTSIKHKGRENGVTENKDLTSDQALKHKNKNSINDFDKISLTLKNDKHTKLDRNSSTGMYDNIMAATGFDNMKVGEAPHTLSKYTPLEGPHDDILKCPHNDTREEQHENSNEDPQKKEERNNEYEDGDNDEDCDNDEDDYNQSSEEELFETKKDVSLRKEDLRCTTLEIVTDTHLLGGFKKTAQDDFELEEREDKVILF